MLVAPGVGGKKVLCMNLLNNKQGVNVFAFHLGARQAGQLALTKTPMCIGRRIVAQIAAILFRSPNGWNSRGASLIPSVPHNVLNQETVPEDSLLLCACNAHLAKLPYAASLD